MKNKTIFAVVAFAVFVLAALGGYFGPGLYHDWRREEFRKMVFVPPEIPAPVLRSFSDQFRQTLPAKDVMFLPEDPFKTLSGKTVRFSDFAGKPVLVNFWATWCLPCVAELPSLKNLAKQFDGHMHVVAVSVDQGKVADQLSSFLEKRDVGDFAAYHDDTGSIAKNLGMRGIPTSFLIGSNGQILYRFEGDAEWDSPVSMEFFNAFLLQNK